MSLVVMLVTVAVLLGGSAAAASLRQHYRRIGRTTKLLVGVPAKKRRPAHRPNDL